MNNNNNQQEQQIIELIERKKASVSYWQGLIADHELEIQALEEKLDYLKKFKNMDKHYSEQEEQEQK